MRTLGAAVAAVVVGLVSVMIASPAQAASYSISASLSKTWMTQSTTVEISGKLSPATPNKTVTIQRFKNGEWVTSTTKKTNSSGKYKATLKPNQFGTASYRVLTAAKGSTAKGKSKVVSVDVYTWFDLAEIATVTDDSRLYFDGGSDIQLLIDGEEFGDDGWASNEDGAGYTKWDLGGACKKITGFAGLDDNESDPAGLGRFKIDFAGPGDYNDVFGDGDGTTVSRNINDTEVLKITSVHENEENATVGYGQPRVFCMEDLPDAA